MPIPMDQERRAEVIRQLRGFHLTEFDEEMSAFKAEKILDHFLEHLGPPIYNQAVQDARKFVQERLDDMDGEVRA